MICPRCGAEIPDDSAICENCGEILQGNNDYDNELVFVEDQDEPLFYRIPWRIVLPLGAAVLIIAAAMILFFVMGRKSQDPVTYVYVPTHATEGTMPVQTRATTKPTETTAPTTVPPTTAAPTTVPPTTVAPTTVPQTTVPPTTAPQTTADTRTDNEKVQDYAQQMGIIDALRSTADSNMTVTITVEQNMVIASYRVYQDSSDEAMKEYFDQLTAYFDEIAANLDRAVYDLRTASGVSSAALMIEATDASGRQFYSRIVD